MCLSSPLDPEKGRAPDLITDLQLANVQCAVPGPWSFHSQEICKKNSIGRKDECLMNKQDRNLSDDALVLSD